MRYLALAALSAALFACSKQPPANQIGNATSTNVVKAAPAGNGAASNGATVVPTPPSSDPVVLASANLARDEAGRDPGSPPLEEVYPDARGMPADVQEYIVRHQGCSHWGGEPGFDANRQKQIDDAVASLCTGLDRLGQEIRGRYASNRQVLDRIKDYEALEE